MRLRIRSTLVGAALLLLGVGSAGATLSSEYIFSTGNAPYTSPTGTLTTLIGGSNGTGVGTFNDQAVSAPTPIGFPFTFNGINYTLFRVNANGLVTLGDSTTNSGTNSLGTAQWPTIATWWDSQHMYDGGGAGNGCTITPVIGVRYVVNGTAPNRVLSIEFSTQVKDHNGSYWWAGCGSPMNSYQVRMFEGTNRIEMHYRSLWASSGQPVSGSIGLSATPGDFISVSPNGEGVTTSSTVANNSIATHLTPIMAGTIYSFTPCAIRVAGRTALPTDGGTAGMAPNDTLLAAASVQLGQSAPYTPADLSLSAATCTARNYQLTISGSAAEDYYFSTPGTQTINGSVTAGGPVQTPSITFEPTTFGRRYATLTLTDMSNNSTRSWVLGGLGSAALVEFRTDNNLPLDTVTTIAKHDTACVGDQTVVIPFDIRLTGNLPVTINSIEIYQTDTILHPGDPTYLYSRDRFDNLIPSRDYYISLSAAPDAAALTTPYVVSAPTRLYIHFDPQRADARYARLVMRTDALNLNEMDPNGVPTQGLIDVGLYGRGRGGRLASTTVGHRLYGLEMGTVRLGTTTRRWLPIANAGRCELRIRRSQFDIASGDVSEFRIDSLSTNLVTSASPEFYILQPGTSDSVLISFTPRQIGSRRASIYLRTNDSMIGGDGVIERGDYIIDLTGEAAGGVYASVAAGGSDLGTGVIGDTAGPFSQGFVRMTNNGDAPAQITSLTISGGDNADFRAVATMPWVGTPYMLEPGGTVDLAVEFRPMGGTPGPRNAVLRIITSTGQTIDAQLKGVAGTREVTVTPVALTFPPVAVGRTARQTVHVVNTGTLPLRLDPPMVGGTDPGFFEVGNLPRLELEPGQMEFMEITFRPTRSGAASATVTLGTNTLNGPITVTLNGTASTTRYIGDDPNDVETGNGGLDSPDNDTSNIELVAGVGGSTLRLDGIVPNPTGNEATVRFSNRSGALVTLTLVDARGIPVWSSALDAAASMTGSAVIPVHDIPSGAYMLRLSAGQTTRTQMLVIAR